MSKKIGKLCVAAVLAAVVGVSAAASACTMQSKHPNARITVEFNEKSYEIDYMLYRNMYPQTVQHFIELADSDFYNETIVHNYLTTDWITGAYSYNAVDEATGEVIIKYDEAFNRTGGMAEYLEKNCKEEAYYKLVTEGMLNGSFSASVYKRSIPDSKGGDKVDVADALPTVIGEFSENGHRIEDGKGLTASFGTLKMMYYKKDSGTKVTVKNSFGQIMPHDYNYNCATSLFAMQVSTSASSYSESNYAVFGQLKNDKSKDALNKLIGDINDYIASLGSSKWSSSVATKVDKEDKFADEGGRDIDQTFTMTIMPLIIRTVKITKY